MNKLLTTLILVLWIGVVYSQSLGLVDPAGAALAKDEITGKYSLYIFIASLLNG
jgi:hypothetical protein